MSEKWILKTLVKLGFTETEAKVYVFLATEGPQKARNIVETLGRSRQQLYRNLKKLQSINVVCTSSEYPARFSAVLFEKVLDLIVEAKTEQQKALQESKEELVSTWKSITKKDAPES